MLGDRFIRLAVFYTPRFAELKIWVVRIYCGKDRRRKAPSILTYLALLRHQLVDKLINVAFTSSVNISRKLLDIFSQNYSWYFI